MKVAVLSTFQRSGGAAIAAMRLVKALNDRPDTTAKLLCAENESHHPDVIAVNDSAWSSKRYQLNKIAERLTILPFETDKEMRFQVSTAGFGQDVSDHPFIQEADVVHLHWFNQGFLSLDSIEKLYQLGKPIVWTLHDMWAFCGIEHYAGRNESFLSDDKQNPILKLQGLFDLAHRTWKQKRKLYRKVEIQFVTCSSWLSEEGRRSELLKHANFQPIPNPIDTSVFKPLDKDACRKHFNIPKADSYLLFAAAKLSDKRKGLNYLVDALKLLKQDESFDQNLIILAFGQKDAGMLSALPYPVHHFGSISGVEEVSKVYNSADVFVSPALQDNLPNTVMEAMACGVPSIAFKTGGLADLIDDKVNGYLPPLEDAQALSVSIKVLLNDKVKLAEFSKASRNKVETHFAKPVVAARYHELYAKLLA